MNDIKSVVILGAGNVGTHIASILKQKGFFISEVYSRNTTHAQELANKIGCEYCDDLHDLNTEADLYIFAVKDDSLTEFNQKLYLPGKIVVHTSGAAPTDILKHISDNYGVFYPLQTFSKERKLNWETIPVLVEADNEYTLNKLEKLAKSIAGNVILSSYEKRRNLHVAAVFVNNFSNYLLQNAYMLMQKNALPFELLKPLAQETIDKAFDLSPQKSQTGPAIRGDEKTLKIHESLLAGEPEILDLYKQLTNAIRNNIMKE
jgi:predicted short-subunit dehydrogenase-like oxidoreductase (DUF2520 family)